MIFSARHFSLSAGGATLAATALCCSPTAAQSGALPTTTLEQQGYYLLSRGKRLESAIASLTEAARREPKNPRYAILLACAQAERAHLLTEAVIAIQLFVRRRAGQEKSIADWETAQQDTQNPLYGKPKPSFPIETEEVPRTRDDNRPFLLTEEAARVRIHDLSESSLSLLEKVAKLSETATPEAQAENAFLSGWTALVLWNQARKVVPESWPVKAGQTAGPERVIAFLERATALQPDNENYRLGLADACQIAAIDQDSPFLPPTRFDSALFSRARTVLLEAAERRPKNGELWYRIACMDGQGEGFAGIESRTPESVAALRKASKLLSSNALVWYSLAAAQASRRDGEGMMASIAEGNASPVLLPIRYKYAAPTPVQWVFSSPSSQYPELSRLIVIGLLRRRAEAVKREDADMLEQTNHAARQISKKYEAALKNPDLNGFDQALFVSAYSMIDHLSASLP